MTPILSRLFLIMALGLCIFQSGQAQLFPPYVGGAGATGYANASAAITDVNAILNNQAGLLSRNNWGVVASASYLYSLPELAVLSAGFYKKLNPNSHISVSVKHFGDRDLNHQVIGISYGRRLFKNWDIALQPNLVSYSIKGYGQKYVPTIEIGSIIHASKKLDIGAHVFNPINIELNENNDISAVFRVGAHYKLSKKASLMAEVQKELNEPFNILAGIQYNIIKELQFKVGVATAQRQFHTGISFNFGKSSIHSAFGWHNQLGFTPSVAYSYDK